MANNILTASRNKIAGVHYTTAHTGKMKNLFSLSTSPLNNINCLKRRENSATICANCFAAALMKRYKNVAPALMKNGEILSARILAADELPVIPEKIELFRFEAFGDLINATHVINYFNIARNNPRTRFALWTKNPRFIAEAIRAGHEKPENLQIVLSSTFTNKPTTTAFNFIDKIFTVYSPAYIEQNDVVINCGARSCATCRRCYLPNPAGVPVQQIAEKLK